MTLDILFVNIPSTTGKKPYDFSLSHSRSLNFGVLSLASYLSGKGFSTTVIDIRSFESEQTNHLIKIINKYSPTTIGLSCISGFSYVSLLEIASLIKTKFPEILIIAGGKDHVGNIPYLVMEECDSIDVVVKGEGELTVENILNHINDNKKLTSVPDIVFRNNGSIYETTTSEVEIPKFIPKLDYGLYEDFRNFSPSIEVSRGCPYNCLFCVNSRNKTIKKSIETILDEASKLCKLYDDHDLKIYFETPIFTHSEDELIHLAEERSKRSLQFTWRTETRVEYLSKNNIFLLQKSGARVLDIGLESASPEILQRMGKTHSPNKYLDLASRAIISAHKHGIILKINILFYIGENLKTLNETYQFLSDHSEYISGISAYPLFKYPGMYSSTFDKDLGQYGGSILEGKQWNERKLYPLNLSSDLSYSQAEYFGLLFGKSFQTLENFFFQKQYGYFPPHIKYSDFKSHIITSGIERFPFSLTNQEMQNNRMLLEEKLRILPLTN